MEEVTWWILVKTVPEGNIILELMHQDKRGIWGTMERFMAIGENVTFEVGLD